MTEEQREDILIKIDERLEDIVDEMAQLSDSRMVGMIGWSEYEKKREALGRVRTSLELEKKNY